MNNNFKNQILISKEELVYKGYSSIEKITFQVKNLEGNWSPRLNREVHSKGDAVAIIPYSPKTDRVWLVEQIRVSATIAGCEPQQLEVPAGQVMPGLSIEESAARELKEETTLGNVSLSYVSCFFPSPGNSRDRVFLYCAIVKGDASISGHSGVESEGEYIKFRAYDFQVATRLLENNVIENSTTMVALMWLAGQRKNLREEFT